jgi:hypothetical protein
MKSILNIVMLAMLFGVTACAPSTPLIPVTGREVIPATSAAARSVIKTSLGSLVVVSTHFVDEVHGTRPGPGEKIMLVILSQPGVARLDPQTFPLDAFDRMAHDTSKASIYVRGDDGSETISTMAGWVDDGFAMGFIVPDTAKSYQLIWPDNYPIDLVITMP